MYLNAGSSNDPSKLSTQTQASQMQQMQSAVQLLTQGVLPRHTTMRPQSAQSTWSNPSLKQHPGIFLSIFYKNISRTFLVYYIFLIAFFFYEFYP